jgi:hypothetical protein
MIGPRIAPWVVGPVPATLFTPSEDVLVDSRSASPRSVPSCRLLRLLGLLPVPGGLVTKHAWSGRCERHVPPPPGEGSVRVVPACADAPELASLPESVPVVGRCRRLPVVTGGPARLRSAADPNDQPRAARHPPSREVTAPALHRDAAGIREDLCAVAVAVRRAAPPVGPMRSRAHLGLANRWGGANSGVSSGGYPGEMAGAICIPGHCACLGVELSSRRRDLSGGGLGHRLGLIDARSSRSEWSASRSPTDHIDAGRTTPRVASRCGARAPRLLGPGGPVVFGLVRARCPCAVPAGGGPEGTLRANEGGAGELALTLGVVTPDVRALGPSGVPMAAVGWVVDDPSPRGTTRRPS